MTLLVSPSIGRRIGWTRCHYGTTCWLIGYQDEMRYLSGSLYLWSLPTLEAMTRTYVPDQSIFQTEPLFDSLYGQIQNFRCVSWRSCNGLYNKLLIKVNNWNILFKDKSYSTLPQPSIVNVRAAKVLHGCWAEFVFLTTSKYGVMFVCWSPS